MPTLKIILALLPLGEEAVQEITAFVASLRASGATAPTDAQVADLEARIADIQTRTNKIESGQ